MKKIHSHHLLLTFMLGVATGMVGIVGGFLAVSLNTSAALALQSGAPVMMGAPSVGAPSCVGCNNIPSETLPPPTCVDTTTGATKPCDNSTPTTATNQTNTTVSGGEGGPRAVDIQPTVNTQTNSTQSNNTAGISGGEGGPSSVSEISSPSVKILKPADGAKLNNNHVEVLVRGHAGYINRGTYKYYTTWNNWGFVHDGTSIGSRPSGNSYPCDADGKATNDYTYTTDWCATFSFDTSQGDHRLTVWGSGIYQSGVKDTVNYTVTVPTPAPANNTSGTTKTSTRRGTLSATADGYMYLVGPQSGYLGVGKREISLSAGNYIIYVYNRTTWELCAKRNVRIDAGKTTKFVVSSVTCKY